MHGFGFGSFDDNRGVRETRVVDKAAEGGFADFSFAEVVVPVDFCSESLFAIVAVNDFDLVASDQAVKFGKGGFVSFFGADVVSSGEDVASVKANSEVGWAGGELKNFC